MVVDEHGSAIARAGVWRAREERREAAYVFASSDHVTSTDATGLAIVDEASSREFVVGKRGFSSRRVVATPGERAVVTLTAACSVVFECTTATGQPVADVAFVVSADRFPDRWWDTHRPTDLAVHPDDGAPAVDSPMLVLRSDPQGIARAVGLQPTDKVFWDCHAPGMALYDGPGLNPPDTTKVRCPGPVYQLRFAPIHGAAFLVEGDEVVTWSATAMQNLGMRGLSGHHVAFVQERLIERPHPDWMAMLTVLADPSIETSWDVEVALARHGVHRFSLRFVPLQDLLDSGPTIVRADQLPISETKACRVRLTLVNLDETELVGPRLVLSDGDTGELRAVCRSGEVIGLPAERFRLAADSSDVQRCLPLPRVIDLRSAAAIAERPDPIPAPLVRGAAPSPDPSRIRIQRDASDVAQVSIRLDRTLYPIAVEGRPGQSDIVVTGRDRRRSQVQLDREGKASLFLPAGSYSFLRTSAAGDETLSELIVAPGERGQRIVRLPAESAR